VKLGGEGKQGEKQLFFVKSERGGGGTGKFGWGGGGSLVVEKKSVSGSERRGEV